VFQPPNRVFANSLVVAAVESYAGFCTLQARVHEIWARVFSGTALSLSRYNPSDCFITYPFPENWETSHALESVGKDYYEFRSMLMVKNNQGVTDTYNRFHDPDERDSEIIKLRDMHTAMDRAVLEAYGWTDIPTDCDFFLDYEIDEEEWGDKKKPYRYRWPDEVRDEVLARLLELNAERAKAEAIAGAAKAAEEAKKKPVKGNKKKPKGMEDMFS